MNDFRKYATKHLGMNGMVLDDVIKAQAQYMNPYILEERQLNVTQMDVFSRLMMDRIIFLGTQIDDYTANTLQAQLLYLDSVDSGKDISIYLNSPGGSVTAGLGIYDTMQFISSDVATICTGMAASMAAVLLVSGQEGKRSALPHSRVMIHQPLQRWATASSSSRSKPFFTPSVSIELTTSSPAPFFTPCSSQSSASMPVFSRPPLENSMNLPSTRLISAESTTHWLP